MAMKFLTIPFILLLAGVPLRADTLAPIVTAASVSPQVVDITQGSETVTVNLTITDDDSGFLSGFASFFNAGGDYVGSSWFDAGQRVGGDAADGNYTVDYTIPEFAAPGSWRIEVVVFDAELNWRSYSPLEESFPVPGHMELTVVNDGAVDSESPVLESVDISPAVADTGAAPATVTFTFEISDDLSGFFYGFIYPYDPFNQSVDQLITYVADFHRISGDEFSGTYEVELELPAGSDPGIWKFGLWIRDRAGNSTYQEIGQIEVTAPEGGTPNFLAHALDATHLPFSAGGSGWVITGYDNWDGIDAATSLPTPDGASATLTTTVTGPGTLRFWWRVDSEEDDDMLSVEVPSASILEQASGDVPWEEVELVLPAGDHEVTWAYTKGASGSAGADRGWIDQVRFVSSSEDSALPVLQSLRITPRVIDNDNNPGTVVISLEITDDFLGSEDGTVTVFDPDGNVAETIFFTPGDRVSGDAHAGVYEVSFEPGANALHGIWRVAVELLEFGSGRSSNYGPGDRAFALTDSEQFFVGGADPDDTEAPRIHQIEVTPIPVDVTNGSREAVVTVHVSDLPFGYSNGYVTLHNPDGSQTGAFYLGDTIGDEFNGIHQATITVPHFAKPGTWTLEFHLWDGPNNAAYPNDDPFPPGVSGDVQVVNGGIADTQQPVVTSLAITPVTVNTGAAPADVQVTISLADDLSGIGDAAVFFYDPADNFRGELLTSLGGGNRISGDEVSGTYQFTRTLPTGSITGQWRVHVFLRDKVGNFRIYGENLDPFPQPGDAYFTVTGAATDWFSSRMAAFGLTGDNALLGADPDRDGWSNAMEVVAKTNPAVAGVNGPFATYSRDSTHFHLFFTIHPDHTVGTSGNYLTVSDGVSAPLRVTGEVQNGLTGAWTIASPVHVSGSTWRVSLPLSSGQRGFIRLRFLNP